MSARRWNRWDVAWRRSPFRWIAATLWLSIVTWEGTSAAAASSAARSTTAGDDPIERLFDVTLRDDERLAALDALLAQGLRPVIFASLLHDRCEALAAQLLRCADPVTFPEAAERAVELLIVGGGEALKHQALALIRRRAAPGDAERLFAAAVQYDGSLRRHAQLLVATLPEAERARLLLAALQESATRSALVAAAPLARDLAAAPAKTQQELVAAAIAQAKSYDWDRAGFACGVWLALAPDSPVVRTRLRELAQAKLDERRAAVMEACQVPLPEAVRDFAFELVATALTDPEWPIRRAAIAAAAALGSPHAVPLLVARMEQERERSLLLRDAARALRRLTGAPLRDVPKEWRRWLADHPTFEVPTADEAAQLEARIERQDRSGTGGSDFFDVPVRSDRVALVIDASGSMATRGKLERACAQARRLVAELPATARVNLLFFDTHVRRFAPAAELLDAATRARIDRFLAAQSPSGGTNLHGALVAALDDPEIDTIYLLSDGAPSAGAITDPVRLRRDVARRNRLKGVVIHAIVLDGDRELLAGLASDTGGTLR